MVGNVDMRHKDGQFGGFKYQAVWELEEDFQDVVTSAWDGKN